MATDKQLAIGYVFNDDGYYDKKHFFENTPKNIANFIIQHQFNDCVITDVLDNFICNSIVGGFIDKCFDQTFLIHELLPILAPLQMGLEEPQEIIFIENDYSYEQVMG